jgi:purine-binding chemotaxis protein CheW
MTERPSNVTTPADGGAQVECLIFRVGAELFALDLAAVEEAVELPDVHRVPEMPETMLGVFNLRERLLPVYSPARALGVPLATDTAVALVLHLAGRRIALAVDDVEDVLHVELAALRRSPVSDAGEGVLLGVIRSGRDLVALVHGEALALACLGEHSGDRPMEAA